MCGDATGSDIHAGAGTDRHALPFAFAVTFTHTLTFAVGIAFSLAYSVTLADSLPLALTDAFADRDA